MSQFLTRLSRLNERLQAIETAAGSVPAIAQSVNLVESNTQRAVADSKRSVRQYLAKTHHFVGGSSLVGPPGAVGPQGLPGPIGPSGNASDVLTPGPKGPDGIAGLNGTKGPVGVAGPTGDQGPVGNAGPTGDQGAEYVGDPSSFARVPAAISSRIKTGFLYDRVLSLTRPQTPGPDVQFGSVTVIGSAGWAVRDGKVTLASAGTSNLTASGTGFNIAGTIAVNGPITYDDFGIARFVAREETISDARPEFAFGMSTRFTDNTSGGRIIPSSNSVSGNGRVCFSALSGGNIFFTAGGRFMDNQVTIETTDLDLVLEKTWRNYYIISEGVVGANRNYRVIVTDGYHPGGTVLYNQSLSRLNFGFPLNLVVQTISPTNTVRAGVEIGAADVMILA